MKKILVLIPPIVVLVVAILNCVLLTSPICNGTYEFSNGTQYAKIIFNNNHYELEAASETELPFTSSGTYTYSNNTLYINGGAIERNSVFSITFRGIEMKHTGAITLQITYLVFLVVGCTAFTWVLLLPSIKPKKGGE